ncbi:MAG TPA: molybdopterin-dependent oxidoreductase [Ktedonobacterales bacterium]
MTTSRDDLPAHPLPTEQLDLATGDLRIAGLAWRGDALTRAELAKLPRARFDGDFACEEGWRVEGLVWEGVALREVVALCVPLPAARWVRIGAGPYSYEMSLDHLDRALLCDTLNGAPLTPEHGAPWRLVIADGACFTSVKWVSALSFTAEPGEATAERIARARIGQG